MMFQNVLILLVLLLQSQRVLGHWRSKANNYLHDSVNDTNTTLGIATKTFVSDFHPNHTREYEIRIDEQELKNDIGKYFFDDFTVDYRSLPFTESNVFETTLGFESTTDKKDADYFPFLDSDYYYDISDGSDEFDLCNMSRSHGSDMHKRSAEHMPNPKSDTDGFASYNFSDEFLNCMLTAVEPECYERIENDSVYVPIYDMVFNKGNFMISENNLLLVCPDFFDVFEEKFSSSIGIISLVGTLISTLFIVLHVIMFFLVEKMRNLPGYCMFSMCLALLTVYICSFIQFQMSDHANCSALGMILYYGLLASFFWMNAISFDVWQSIRMATTKLRLSSERPVLVRFCLYSLYAWGTPLAIVLASVVADLLSTDERYKLIFNEHTCWFKNKSALLVYFALPLFIVLSVDILFFISSFYMIHKSMASSSASNSRSNLRSRLFLSLKLSTAMGLMWIFGVIATLTQREWLYYLYSIFNALQGVFIFFSFSVNNKTLKAIKKVSNVRNLSVRPRAFPKPSFYRTTVQTENES